jgi:hypothetical protein
VIASRFTDGEIDACAIARRHGAQALCMLCMLCRRTLELAGPAFIKWGQWAATRHDLFPPDFCSELEKLHTQAPGHALPHTERAVREVGSCTTPGTAPAGTHADCACEYCVLHCMAPHFLFEATLAPRPPPPPHAP